ncbi:MAG: sulfite exporter TauE/SafE [Chlamydiales bacterium]|jgi:sulfite exporter TauE/SafE
MSIPAAELLPFAVLGLLGAVHCAGMCGGFAVAVAGPTRASTGMFLQRQLAYVFGKALTYAVLGMALSAGSHAVAHAGAELSVAPTRGTALSWTRNASAWIAGLTMIWFGLRMLGCPFTTWSPARWRAASALRRMRSFFDGALSLPGGVGAMATGLATGLLPCGLSWSAFALAAGQTPAAAFAGLLIFGLATAPALVLTAWGWRGLDQRHRASAVRLAGPLLLLFGLFTLARAGAGPDAVQILPDCCRDAGESAAD